MRPTGNRSRDLGCLGAAERPSPPASPCQTKEKRWRTSANSCQSCHALRRRLSLDEQLVEIPAETCRPASPPSRPPPSLPPCSICWFISLHRLFIRQNSSKSSRQRPDYSEKCLKIQLRSCDPDWGADRCFTPVIPRGCAPVPKPPQRDTNLATPPSTYPAPFLHADDKEEGRSCHSGESLIKLELWDLLSAPPGALTRLLIFRPSTHTHMLVEWKLVQSCRRSLNANSFNGMLRDITCRSHGVHVMTTAEVCEETDTEARIEKRASRTHRYCRQFLESIKGT